MRLSRDPGKYIGLPSILGRSKSEALNFLKYMIMNKIMGWKSKLLNNTGKEVLIKAIITVVPMNVVSVF